MTAGELIRQEIANGATVLGLAKRIAGNSSDDDTEVKRWRYVVLRADKGGEPSERNIPQIEKTFGVEVSRPDRLTS